MKLMKKSNLENWAKTTLGELCHLDNGVKVHGEKLPLLDVKYLRGKKEAEYLDSGVILNDGQYVILVDGENSGEVFRIYETGYMGSTFKCLTCYDDRLLEYLLYIIKFNQKMFRENKKGSAIPHLDKKLFKELSVNLPPLAEQGRIVAKIEELFAGIDAGVENLKSVKNQIALYRQSVLKSAFDGTLTAKWREQKYFIKHYIVMEKSPFEIPHEWEWFKLSQLGNIGRGKSKHRPRNDKKLFGGKYPFIQTGEIKACKRYLKDYTETYSDFGLAQSKLWSENTLCITIAANIAETAILKMKACFPDSVVGFIKNDLISKIEYIEYYIRLIRENLDKAAPATAQKNINLQTLNEILVPVPTLAEQERIVAEIESRFERADVLEAAVDRALNDAEKLKQAVLKKAFSGELVPQNPDDEPASVLLDRIRAARASEQPARKRKLKR